jgi:hypothetical protein
MRIATLAVYAAFVCLGLSACSTADQTAAKGPASSDHSARGSEATATQPAATGAVSP